MLPGHQRPHSAIFAAISGIIDINEGDSLGVPVNRFPC